MGEGLGEKRELELCLPSPKDGRGAGGEGKALGCSPLSTFHFYSINTKSETDLIPGSCPRNTELPLNN